MIVTSLQYNECVITIAPNLPPSINKNKEFVFLVDCNGSMKGNYIQKSSECLELLIKSLPSGSFFNIVKFGYSFEKLFAKTKLLANETMQEGIEFTKNIQSNLKSTNIYNALEDFVSCPNIHGQRQVFILSDGEVENAENVIELISKKANDNRIFTICIGHCYDSGFNEYLAESTSGKSVYINEGDSINQKVIPLLQSSLNLPFSSIEFHVNSDNNIKYDIIPFSNSSINANGSFIFYLINYERFERNPFLNGITIKGKYGDENIEIPFIETIKISNADSLCYGLNALIYYNYIKSYDLKANINNTEKANNVAYSKTFGILSKYTMYSISINRHIIKRKQTSSKKVKIKMIMQQ